jgi:capsular polysaccharide biosynthesis protein
LKRLWIVAAVALTAAGAALLVSLLGSSSYRTEMTIVVGHGNGPLSPETGNDRVLAEALRELIESRSVAKSVVDNLDLAQSPDELLDRMSVDVPQPGVLEVAIEDGERERVRQIAQEVGLVFAALVSARFGASRPGGDSRGAPPLSATIWDPPSEPAEVTRRPVRNAALAGAAGLVLGIAGVGILGRPWKRAAHAPPREPQPLPIRLPAGGETAAVLARRERELEAKEEELVSRERELAVAVAAQDEEAAALRAAQASIEPEPEAAAVAPEPAPSAAVAPGEWNLNMLERLVSERARDFPDRADEWGYYLVYLRDYVGIDGRLPHTFDALVAEVFADLLEPATA